MAVKDASAEEATPVEEVNAVQLLIGVTGDVNPVELRSRAASALAAGGLLDGLSAQVVVSWPGVDSAEMEPGKDGQPAMIPYRPAAANEAGPWAQISAAQRGVLSLAAELKASACVVMDADMDLLQGEGLRSLVAPVMDRQCDLVMPIYALHRYEGLLNTAILMPLTRALYCKRVQIPLAPDFAVSQRFAERTGRLGNRGLLWPSITAAQETMQVGQVHLPAHHRTPMEGLDLTTVLTQIAGSLFQEVEQTAAVWQRGRSAQATPVWGQATSAEKPADAIEVRPMIESFQLAVRNLDELWQLVLPPVTLLELKHLARSTPDNFKMADRLWARIVYDFALAHRLRAISRTHLMGALTPLYLGWVASYVQEVAAMTMEQVVQRQEQLARAFEENKPYLVSRWRWPDRFNP
ncbi:MAG: hypothetical protein ACP5M4_03060 [Acidobacteriaceae bacterium]